MKDALRNNPEPIEDLSPLKQRIRELEQTERDCKQMEELLRALSSRQEAILAAVPEIIMEVDNNKVYTWANSVGIEFFGEDVIGKEAAFYFEGEQETYDKVSPLFNGAEDIIYVESWQRRRDGEKRLLAWWCRVLKDENGQVTGALSSARDITDRKRIENELRQNQEVTKRLAQEMAIIAEIGLVIGSTLHIDEVYERFAAETRKLIHIDSLTVNLYNFQENTLCVAYVSGLDIDGRRQGDPLVLEGSLSEAVIRTRTSLCIQPASIDEIVGQFPRLSPIFQAGLRSIMCVPLVYRDEVIGVLHFRSKKQNAYTEQDLRLAERIGMQIAGAIANAQLYADLKKTENSLRESEGRFRGLVEQAAVGVAEIEMSTGRFFTVNRRLCEMVGRTEEELLDTTFQAITHPEDIHLHEEKTALLVAGEIGHYSLEKRYLRKDGGIVWVNITVSPLWKPGEAPGRNMIVAEDITDRKRMEEALRDRERRYRELSIIDDLTQLYNSRHFSFQLKIEIDRSNRYRHPLTLLLLDLDNFKHFNDTYGHVEGDQVLMRLGQVVKRCLRETDFAYRYGGEEFTILLPMTTSKDGAVTAERIRTEFKKETFSPAPGQDVHKTVSIGLAQYRPQEEMKAFVHRVDQLMYQGKKNGKDRVCCES